MPPSAGLASSNSMASSRAGTAANVEGSTLSFAGSSAGGRAKSAGARPKSKGLELMSNTKDTSVLRDSAEYRAEVEIGFQHLRKLLEIFQKVGPRSQPTRGLYADSYLAYLECGFKRRRRRSRTYAGRVQEGLSECLGGQSYRRAGSIVGDDSKGTYFLKLLVSDDHTFHEN
jgi:hypothetical protein